MKLGSYRNIRRLSKGTSLVEVMVSVLILSIGLLGIAAMQATALRNSQSSMERTQTVVMSYAVIDAMRANLTAARNNQYDAGWTCAAPTVTSLVTSDMAAWISSMKNSIGDDACGRISCGANGAANDNICTIDIRWNDSRGTGGSSVQRMTMVSRL